jgi:hypothetical protein
VSAFRLPLDLDEVGPDGLCYPGPFRIQGAILTADSQTRACYRLWLDTMATRPIAPLIM